MGLLRETDAIDELYEFLLVWLGGGGEESGEKGRAYATPVVLSRVGGWAG